MGETPVQKKWVADQVTQVITEMVSDRGYTNVERVEDIMHVFASGGQLVKGVSPSGERCEAIFIAQKIGHICA